MLTTPIGLFRWILQGTPHVPAAISPPPTEYEIRDTHMASKQYVTCPTTLSPKLTTLSHTVYENGNVCISILHPPEEDSTGYEHASERWSPVQTPSTILLSVISMLSSPNDESAANVEAARQWRDDPAEFKKRVRRCVRDSIDNGF
jgi:ubiquitin-conjugating enzyme E2 G1